MAVRVVDASAIGALLFGEPDAGSVAAALSGADLVAPTLLPFEVANICLKKIRRHRGEREALRAAFALFSRMTVRLVEVDHLEALELGERAGLTAYDASYLWLARRLGAELVTLDRRLAAAAGVSRARP